MLLFMILKCYLGDCVAYYPLFNCLQKGNIFIMTNIEKEKALKELGIN